MEYERRQEELLKKKVYPQTKKEDFEAFWRRSVEQLRAVPLKIERRKLETPYDKQFTTWELTYNTHDDTVITAWFSCPNGATGKLPCVIYYHGGSLKKEIYPATVATGVCCLAMDVRGQGGTSPDRGRYDVEYNGGLMTRGVLDREQFYMRNIYLDAVRAVDVAASLAEVDPGRIVTYGGSQGGALSIAAAALGGKSMRCYSYMTSYCCLHRRTELGSRIFGSTHEFLKTYPEHTDTVFDVLTYFDAINMVSLLNVPTRFCLGVDDPVCLPEFVYSAYAHAPCEKSLMIVPFAPHLLPAAFKKLAEGEFAAL